MSATNRRPTALIKDGTKLVVLFHDTDTYSRPRTLNAKLCERALARRSVGRHADRGYIQLLHLRASLPLRCSRMEPWFGYSRHHFKLTLARVRLALAAATPARWRRMFPPERRSAGGGERFNGRPGDINVGFDYLSAYRETATAAGGGGGEGAGGSRDGVRA